MFKKKVRFRCRTERQAIKLGNWFLTSNVEVVEQYKVRNDWYFTAKMDAFDRVLYCTTNMNKSIERSML